MSLKTVTTMQDVIVGIILILVAVYIVYKLVRAFTKKPGSTNKCVGCDGCALSEELKKNCDLLKNKN